MIERELKKKFELASKLAEFSALLDEFKRKFLEERSNKTWNRFSIPVSDKKTQNGTEVASESKP